MRYFIFVIFVIFLGSGCLFFDTSSVQPIQEKDAGPKNDISRPNNGTAICGSDTGCEHDVTCQSLGYFGEAMALCQKDTCTYDTGACIVCEDGVSNVCTREKLTALNNSCENLTPQTPLGEVTCNSECQFDTSDCFSCNDDAIKDSTEECDGRDFGMQTCSSLGLGTGTLSCQGCQVDTSGCMSSCGDGVVSPDEECDIKDGEPLFSGEIASCDAYNSTFHQGGKLLCDDQCKVDVSSCNQCGDGVWNEGYEECDGTQFGPNETCPAKKPFNINACSETCNIVKTACKPGYVQLSAGDSHACGLTTEGSIKCWGIGDYSNVFSGNNWEQVSAGKDVTCGLKKNGDLECYKSGPELIGSMMMTKGNVKKVSVGEDTFCVIESDDTMKCFGFMNNQKNHTSQNFEDLSVGSYMNYSDRVCGITSTDKKMECFYSGQAGTWGATFGDSPFSKLSVGSDSACAKGATGWVCDSTPPPSSSVSSAEEIALGFNRGWCVLNSTSLECSSSFLPGTSLNPATIEKITVGNGFACAIQKIDGKAICWGKSTLSNPPAP